MDPDQILAWVRAERLSLADFLDDLDAHEWQADSLCDGWTVHQVLGHITSQDTVRSTVIGLIRARGNWDRMNAQAARDHAARFTPAELIAQLRAAAASTHRAPLSGPLDPLVDIMIHGQDIARPLGRTRSMPTEQAIAALAHLIRSPFYGARKRLKGLRLTATDAAWTHGDGPDEIRGPLSELFLVATGRSAGLAGLTGSGVARFTAVR